MKTCKSCGNELKNPRSGYPNHCRRCGRERAYAAKHRWIERAKQRPTCAHCGGPHTDPMTAYPTLCRTCGAKRQAKADARSRELYRKRIPPSQIRYMVEKLEKEAPFPHPMGDTLCDVSELSAADE